jgi:DNA-binding CsgD family transcriptional regulator
MQLDLEAVVKDLEGRFERDQRPVLAFQVGARLVYVNTAFERLTGLDRASVVGVLEEGGDHPWHTEIEQDRKRKRREFWQLGGRSVEGEWQHADGHPFTVRFVMLEVLGDGDDRVGVFCAVPFDEAEDPLRVKGPMPEFTSRELEVARLLCRGRSVAQIAAELSISPNTVKNHQKKIYGKAGVSSQTRLAWVFGSRL